MRQRVRGGQAILPASAVRSTRLLGEALDAVSSRRLRTALTVVGTLLGVASFVATLGLTSTANAQIASTFNRTTSTEVKLQLSAESGRQTFSPHTPRRLRRIQGVLSAGGISSLSASVSRLPTGFQASASSSQLRVSAVDVGFWDVAEVSLSEGRLFDSYLQQQPVAVLGSRAAQQLGVGDLSSRPAIYIDDTPFAVVGIVSSARREEVTATSVTIPLAYAQGHLSGQLSREDVVIGTQVGAGLSTAQQAPNAVSPYSPSDITVVYPPAPTVLAKAVSRELQGLFLALAFVCVTIGVVGIANVNFLSVSERIPEVGLRRSLGATRSHIALQFIVESLLLGTVGGVAGGAVGQLVVVVVSVLQNWSPTANFLLVAAAGPMGALVGVVAGLLPSLRAAAVDPVESFRHV